jgi:hypothetical protein
MGAAVERNHLGFCPSDYYYCMGRREALQHACETMIKRSWNIKDAALEFQPNIVYGQAGS